MWRHRHLFLLAGGMVLAGAICWQLLYPYDAALPFSYSMGNNIGGKSRDELAADFQKSFETSVVELTSGEKTVSMKLSAIGATANTEQMTRELVDYPLWQRFIPGTLLQKRDVSRYNLSLSGSQVTPKLEGLAKELSYPAVDAAIAIESGELKISKAKDGQAIAARDVRTALTTATYRPGETKVTVKGTSVKPRRLDGDVSTVKEQAERALGKTLRVMVPERTAFTPDKAMVASWLSIKMEDTPTLVVDREKVAAYADMIKTKTQTPARPAVVALVDGIEQSRTAGAVGRSIDSASITTFIVDHLVEAEAELVVDAPLHDVAPGITTTRTYSHSEAGLRAYVSYATSTQNVRIVVQQLSAPGWSASGRADESIPSASTYKLYVMMRVFDDINSGKLTWDTPMLDTTAGGCFERTIVPSTNPCAEEWIRQYGRQALNDYVHGKGFSGGTGFTFRDATHTTAGDLAKYLIGLNNGSLITGSNRDMLLEKMGRQLYRTGIPAGAKGWAQDKVGFLWDYIHDAAIVHNPRGTYVLVVMTKGYSYGYIANVARQIDTILYP